MFSSSDRGCASEFSILEWPSAFTNGHAYAARHCCVTAGLSNGLDHTGERGEAQNLRASELASGYPTLLPQASQHHRGSMNSFCQRPGDCSPFLREFVGPMPEKQDRDRIPLSEGGRPRQVKLGQSLSASFDHSILFSNMCRLHRSASRYRLRKDTAAGHAQSGSVLMLTLQDRFAAACSLFIGVTQRCNSVLFN